VKIVVHQIAHRETYKHKNSNYQIHTFQHSKAQNDIQVSPGYSITKELPLIESIKQDMETLYTVFYHNNKIMITIH
jgi:hypothetical protein